MNIKIGALMCRRCSCLWCPFSIFKGALLIVKRGELPENIKHKRTHHEIYLNLNKCCTFSLFAMNVATSASTTVDLMKSHTNSINYALAMQKHNKQTKDIEC